MRLLFLLLLTSCAQINHIDSCEKPRFQLWDEVIINTKMCRGVISRVGGARCVNNQMVYFINDKNHPDWNDKCLERWVDGNHLMLLNTQDDRDHWK